VRINDVSVTEGNSGTTQATFTVTLSVPGQNPVTLDYATADGAATAPSDYQSASGSLTFAPGETSKTVTVLVNGDTLYEGTSEAFSVKLSNLANATLLDGVGQGTIVDDDPVPAVS